MQQTQVQFQLKQATLKYFHQVNCQILDYNLLHNIAFSVLLSLMLWEDILYYQSFVYQNIKENTA